MSFLTSKSSMNVNSQFINITCEEYLSLKPNPQQAVKRNGKPAISQKRVNNLMKALPACINSPVSPITCSSDDYIIQGHHRQEAVKKALGLGLIKKTDKVLLYRLKEQYNSLAAGTMLVVANDTSKSNHYVKSRSINCAQANKILKPLFKALSEANKTIVISAVRNKALVETVLSYNDLNKLNAKLAEVLNKDGGSNFPKFLAKKLVEGNSLEIFGSDLYSNKTGLASSVVMHTNVNIDLSDYIDVIHKRTKSFFELMFLLKDKIGDRSLWNKKFGNNTTLQYILFALCLRETIGQKEREQIVRNIEKDKNNIIHSVLKKDFLTSTVDSEQHILSIITKGFK